MLYRAIRVRPGFLGAPPRACSQQANEINLLAAPASPPGEVPSVAPANACAARNLPNPHCLTGAAIGQEIVSTVQRRFTWPPTYFHFIVEMIDILVTAAGS